MNNLSIPTLQFTGFIVFLTCGGVFAVGWYLRRIQLSFPLFAVCFFLAALSSLAHGPFDQHAPFWTPVSWSLSSLMMWAGFRTFDGERPFTPAMLIVAGLPPTLHHLISAAGAEPHIVNTVRTLAYAIQHGVVAHHVFSTSRRSPLRRIIGWTLIGIITAICAPLVATTPEAEYRSVVYILTMVNITSILLITAILALEAECAYAALARTAYHDPLTNALNRHGLQRELFGKIEPGGILLIDIDHFKSVNDKFGHLAGDEVLRCFTRQCAAVLPADSLIARFGGEEFVAIIRSIDEQATVAFAERLRTEVRRTSYKWEKHSINVTVSIGVAMFEEIEQATIAIGAADSALYRAKRSGRDRVCVAESESVRDPIAQAPPNAISGLLEETAKILQPIRRRY